MDEIRSWALMVCTAAILCGLLGQLLPEGSIGRAARSLLSLFFLSLLLEPLGTLKELELRFPALEEQPYSQQLSQSSDELAYSLAEGHILELIREKLAEEEIPASALELDFWEEAIFLDLSLPLPQKEREGELRQLLQRELGITLRNIRWQEEEKQEG